MSEAGLKDHVFDHWPHDDRGGISATSLSWEDFKKECERRGMIVHTTDFWSPEKSRPDDILFVHTHPGETFWWRLLYRLKYFRSGGGFALTRWKFLYDNYRFFARRILFHLESPGATPYVYKGIDEIRASGVYTKIILGAHVPGNKYDYFNYYLNRDRNIVSPYFNDSKRKYLVMVNANTTPHSFDKNELYGERWRAIKYFSEKPGFDLFGYRWNEIPRHPRYVTYGKYARKVWRGTIDNKMQKLAEYKFSLCFENYACPGYVSEKIFDCLAAGTIPVYLGAPDVTDIVPESCFIDFRKFSAKGAKSYDELHGFLSAMSEKELAERRAAILNFLNDDSTISGTEQSIDRILS